MKRLFKLFALALAFVALASYIFWDFDFFPRHNFEVRNIGDTREIFVTKYPKSSIPPDVIFFVEKSNVLFAISSDLSKQKGTGLRGRANTCTIFVTDLKNGESSKFASGADFSAKYVGGDQLIVQIMKEYDRQQC